MNLKEQTKKIMKNRMKKMMCENCPCASQSSSSVPAPPPLLARDSQTPSPIDPARDNYMSARRAVITRQNAAVQASGRPGISADRIGQMAARDTERRFRTPSEVAAKKQEHDSAVARLVAAGNAVREREAQQAAAAGTSSTVTRPAVTGSSATFSDGRPRPLSFAAASQKFQQDNQVQYDPNNQSHQQAIRSMTFPDKVKTTPNTAPFMRAQKPIGGVSTDPTRVSR